MQLTSPPRTLVDAAAIVGPRGTVSALEQVLHEHRCTLPTLIRSGNRHIHPRRPGSVIFRGVMLSRAEWRGVARSDLEVRVVESARDKRRDRKLVLSGWQPARFPELEIDHSLPELVDDLGQILRDRGWCGAMGAI